VLEPGTLGTGDAVDLVGAAPRRVTLAEVNAFLRDEAGTGDVPERLLAWTRLPTPWRVALERRVAAAG
jgi:MOSC domain-containing protein YiiM